MLPMIKTEEEEEEEGSADESGETALAQPNVRVVRHVAHILGVTLRQVNEAIPSKCQELRFGRISVGNRIIASYLSLRYALHPRGLNDQQHGCMTFSQSRSSFITIYAG